MKIVSKFFSVLIVTHVTINMTIAFEPEVLEKLKTRQAKFKTVNVQFEWSQRYAAGAINEIHGQSISPIIGSSPKKEHNLGTFPTEETVLTSSNRCCCEDENIRFELNHWKFYISDQLERRFVRSNIVIVMGPKGLKSLYPNGLISEATTGSGNIYGDRNFWEGLEPIPPAFPLIFHYRPLSKKLAIYDLERFKSMNVELNLQSRKAKEYRYQSNSGLTLSIWLDTEDATLLRMIQYNKGQIITQTNCNYSEYQGTKVLSNIEFQYFSKNGKILTDSQINFETNFAELAKNKFDIIFPQNTSVYDHSSGTRYLIDSKLRMIPVDEFHKPTGAPSISQQEIAISSDDLSTIWYFVVLISLIVILVSLYVFMKYRSKK
ncbi:MAG: hypothetical protein N2112_06690 [Gemmataceae bacterium]|jgi:outer membrane lipoprotein-sorting protein|nr:hypothetical protein [Gemmataceae bacterium]